ncbi:DUF5723 family protein [Robertkochia sediminum]|uniref:DUF5723 family protein n=1 Tax=Robertkochia sediminum TaxID=2785326 RepID=UPI001931FEBC|nr:DUF5723 family protein [Robertkochia sediminum]MBL7472827.1 hypothetical protein [Robertkochia sediminum]
MIRIVIYILLLLGSSMSLRSQNKQLLYNFREIPQHVMVNPGGLIHQRAYVGVPFLSGVSAQVGSSGFTTYDLFADDGVNFNIKVRDVLYRLNRNDIVEANQQLEILFAGFKGKGESNKNFYTFGIYQELDVFNFWPEDLAFLAYEGNAGNLGRSYDLRDLNGQGELMTVFHFGINRRVNEKLTYGGRLKLYSSLANVSSVNNSGTFITLPGTDNVYSHNVVADMEWRTSGYIALTDKEDPDPVAKRIAERAFFGGNYGLGVDLGVTYAPNPSWTFTASILDLGMLVHTTDVEIYTLKGAYELEGIEFLFGEETDDDFLDDYWERLKADLDEQLPRDTIADVYTSFRPVKFNGSVMHNFGKLKYRKTFDCSCDIDDTGYENSVGLQLYAIKRPQHINAALTAFYYRRIFNFLRGKFTYTVSEHSFTNIGLGISTHFANFNFYLLADNLLEYSNLAQANQASVQFGFNYIFKGAR